MQKIWDYYIEKLSDDLSKRMKTYCDHCNEPNPNECLQKASFLTLKEVLENQAYNQQDLLMLGTLVSILTHKMKAEEELIEVLYQINHPFTNIYAIYFGEEPSKYRETLEKIEQELVKLEQRKDYSFEQKALVLSIESWIYGQQGNIPKLKEIHKIVKKNLPKFNNTIIQFGLQDTCLNLIWWYLHSGTEINVRDLLDFIEPYILEYKFYKTYTSFLNVKGSIESFIGNNNSAMKSFQQLIEVHKKYHDDYRLSIALGNLAEVYVAIGKIQDAKNMMEEAIQLYKNSTGKWPYLYLTEIGNIYFVLGDKRAEDSFLHAYDIQKKEKSMHKAFILYEVVHFYLRKEELKKAKQYLKEVRMLAKELETPSINARVDYLKGFYELLNYNISNGIAYLQSALQQAQLTKDMEILQFCNIQLATAYLFYYKFVEKQEYINHAMNYIDAVYQLALENHHSQALVIAILIRAILNAISGNLEKALNQLKTLEEKKKELDVTFFSADVSSIRDNILTAQTSGELKLPMNRALDYILPQFRDLLSFKMMQKQTKRAEVLGILIISESGIPVFTKLNQSLKTDDLILSGLLMAINQLANSIIKGQKVGRLQNVTYADFSITLQSITNGMVAVIATELTAEIRIWALALAERIKEIPSGVTSFISSIPDKIEDLLKQMNLE
ncbi:MAG: tetratricopeptide repeat protein [Candidatus Heimdallarchaeaceae archaeon]